MYWKTFVGGNFDLHSLIENIHFVTLFFSYFVIIVPKSFAVHQFRDGGRSENLGWH